MVSVPNGVDIVWQLEGVTKKTWLSYVDEVQEALTSAAVSGRKAVNLKAGRTALVADIHNLSQLSKGGEKRMRGLVKSGEEFYSWEVETGGVWQPISVGHAVQLEEVRDISNTVTVASVKYDLVNMKREADNATIRREKNIPRKIIKSGATFNIKLAEIQNEEEDGPEVKKSKSKKSTEAAKEEEELEEAENKPVMESLIKKGLIQVPRVQTVAVPIFISKWVDFSQQFGFIFKLSDGGLGVSSNDDTKMGISACRRHLEFTDVKWRTSAWCVDENSNLDLSQDIKERCLKLKLYIR